MKRAAVRDCLILLAWISVTDVALSQRAETVRKVDVYLNGEFLSPAHVHVRSGDRRIQVDQGCVQQDEVARLLGGWEFIAQRGRNLDAVRVGGGQGAALRVMRLGRISSRVHRSDNRLYIPLLDFVRALGATIVPGRSDRIDLTLDRSDPAGIMGPSYSERRRR